MMMSSKYKPLIIIALFFYCCFSSKAKAESFLIIKVSYFNSKYPEYFSTSYTLISHANLSNFKIYHDSIHSPNIAYNVTANGGLYLSRSFTDIYSLGCCEFGSVEESLKLNFKGMLSKDELKKYAYVNRLSFEVFETEEAVQFKFKKGSATYDIKIWMSDIKFCRCKLYMETSTQPIYGDEAAYLQEIGIVSIPKKKSKRKLKKILSKIIEVDSGSVK